MFETLEPRAMLAAGATIGVALDALLPSDAIIFEYNLEHLGDAQALNISMPQDLDFVFGAGNYAVSAPVLLDGPGTLSVNASFNGSSVTELIGAGSTMAVGETARLQIEVTVSNVIDSDGPGLLTLGQYENQVTLTAEDAGDAACSDLSNRGTSPDPDGDGDPTERDENQPTPVTLNVSAQLGAALNATVDNAANTITYDYYLQHYGNTEASDVSVPNDLDAIFGAGNYTVGTPAIVGIAPTGLLLNDGGSGRPLYDGETIDELIAFGSRLLPGETAQIRIVVQIQDIVNHQSLGLGTYHNQVFVSAKDAAGSLCFDASHNGSEPDPNGNGDPREADENDVTPAQLLPDGAVGVAKNASLWGDTVTYDYYLEQFGGYDTLSISLPEDLDAVFGAGNYTVGAPILVNGPATFSINTGFDGAADTELVATSSSLAVGDSAQIQIVVSVWNMIDPDAAGPLVLGEYVNQVTVTWTDSQGVRGSDNSDSGIDPDPNGDQNPSGVGEGDPTHVRFPRISAMVGAAFTGTVDDDAMTVQYDYYLEHFGNTSALDSSIAQDFDAVFGAGNYTLSPPPILVSGPSTLLLNPSFDGSTDTQLIDAGSAIGVGDTAQIRLTVSIAAIADEGYGIGTYRNQVAHTGQDGNGTVYRDASDDGRDPDPNGDGDPTGAGENDPTYAQFAVPLVNSSIGGLKWSDENGNGIREVDELPVGGVVIYLDANDNGVLDSGESQTVTASDGTYTLDQPTLGINIVREVPPADTVPTFPAGDGAHRVAITADNTTVSNIDFGNDPVDAIIIDDGDDGFTVLTGQWDVSLCWLMYQGDAHYLCGTTGGENSIQWEFTDLTPGTSYRVSTTWLAGANRSVDAPFTLSGGVASTTVIVNQTIPPAAYPNSFADDGVNWMDLAPVYTIMGDTLTVQLTDDHSGGCIVGDGVRIVPVSNALIVAPIAPAAPSPQASELLQVRDDTTLLLDTLSTVDFGTVEIDDLVTRILVVENPASARSAVTLGDISFENDDFALAASVAGTELAPGQSTTIQIVMDTTTSGPRSTDVAMYSENGDRLFSIVLSGQIQAQVVPASDGIILDDGDQGFDDGRFSAVTDQGNQGDVHFSRPTWNRTASWTFNDLPAGIYRVSASWKAQDNLATNAPFSILDGASVVATMEIDQRQEPADFVAAGTSWKVLGGTYAVSSGTLTVQLTDVGANQYVVADSVYIERLSPLVSESATDLALSEILDELAELPF